MVPHSLRSLKFSHDFCSINARYCQNTFHDKVPCMMTFISDMTLFNMIVEKEGRKLLTGTISVP